MSARLLDMDEHRAKRRAELDAELQTRALAEVRRLYLEGQISRRLFDEILERSELDAS